MKKRFYLVRHGEKVKIQGDPPLSEKGIIQAKRTGEYFKSVPISRILTSPIRRSVETAECISKVLGLNYEINDLLKERVDWGDDPNQSFEDFVAMWEKASRNGNWQPPIGDSSVNAGRRMEKVISDLLQGNGKHILLVTHGGIICDYLRSEIPGNLLKQFTKSNNLIFDDSVKVCSITTIEIDTSNLIPKLISFADADHLDGNQ